MMRFAVVLVLIVLLSTSAAFAQGIGGVVGLFADPGGTMCNLWDTIPGLLSVYVVHIWHDGATVLQFSAPQPDCFIGIWLSDTIVFPVTIGNSQTGVVIGYGYCASAPTHVLIINYFVQALTGPCCPYRVLPDPSLPSGQIEVWDCASNLVFADGGRAIINPDQSCMCDYPVPVVETTWGQIKAQYQ